MQFTAYDHDRGRLPWDIQVGFTKGLAHAPFRFSVTYVKLNRWDLDYVKDASIYDADDNVDNTYSRHVGWGDMLFRHLLFGVEFLPSKNFSLTASYNHRRHAEFNMDNAGSFSGFAFGGQLHVYKFDLGVSYAIYGPSGGVFGLSIGTAISSFAH